MKKHVAAFNVMTFNDRAFPKMAQAKVTHDARLVKGLASLTFWQEAGWYDYYSETYETELPDLTHIFPGGSCGTSFDPKVWEAADEGRKVLLHTAVKGVCDERHALVLDLIHRETGVRYRTINFHHAPKRGGLGIPAQRRGNAILKRLISGALKDGLPVILGGDANQTGKFLGGTIDGQRIVYVSGSKGRGIDKLMFVAPKGMDFVTPKASYRVVKGQKSDHNPVLVTAHVYADKPKSRITQARELLEAIHSDATKRGLTGYAAHIERGLDLLPNY